MEPKNKIRQFIEDNLIVFDDEAAFSDEDNIFELGFVNSLFAMKLVNYIEQEFGIVVDNDDLDLSNFSSVSSIARLVARHE